MIKFDSSPLFLQDRQLSKYQLDILNDMYILYKKIGFFNIKIYNIFGKFKENEIKNEFINIDEAIKKLNELVIENDVINNINKDLKFENYKKIIIDDVKKHYKHNKNITENSFLNSVNYSKAIIKKYFRTFINLLKEADLYDEILLIRKSKASHAASNRRFKNDKIHNFSKEDAKNKSIEIFNKYGFVTKELFLKESNFDKITLLNLFDKKFKNLLKYSGLEQKMKVINNKNKGSNFPNNSKLYRNTLITNFTDEQIFKDAEEIFNKFGELNKKLFFQETKYHLKTFIERYGSFRNFIKKSNLYEKIKVQRSLTHYKVVQMSKQEVANELLEFHNKNNKIKSSDFYKYSKSTRGLIVKYFGGFNEALIELGLDINIDKTRTINLDTDINIGELIDELKNIYKKFGYINYLVLKNHAIYPYYVYLNMLGGNFESLYKNLGLIRNEFFYNCKYCLYLFEQILNSKCKFEKTFDWLINSETSGKFRIDGYFNKYNLAVEYDGAQHYEYIKHFHSSYEDFIRSQERDKLKEKLLLENGVKLIRVRYDEPLTEEYLREKLIKAEIIKES